MWLSLCAYALEQPLRKVKLLFVEVILPTEGGSQHRPRRHYLHNSFTLLRGCSSASYTGTVTRTCMEACFSFFFLFSVSWLPTRIARPSMYMADYVSAVSMTSAAHSVNLRLTALSLSFPPSFCSGCLRGFHTPTVFFLE